MDANYSVESDITLTQASVQSYEVSFQPFWAQVVDFFKKIFGLLIK